MFRHRPSPLLAFVAAGLLAAAVATAQPTAIPTGGFHFELEAPVPGTPAAAFAAWTGETLSWWDHHFSEHPVKLYFDTKPGGGFWEIFDKAGHGAQHAVVNYVDPPKMLRFTEDQVNSTIALCASLASGNLEGARSGGRALREGAAVRNALLAVALAGQGHVGGETVLEVDAGT